MIAEQLDQAQPRELLELAEALESERRAEPHYFNRAAAVLRSLATQPAPTAVSPAKMLTDEQLDALMPTGEAQVLWFDPRTRFGPEPQGKIIDASMAFMSSAPLGTKLFSREEVRATVRAAIAATQPAPQPKLDRDVQCGNMILRKGLPVSMLIERAARELEYQQRPEVAAKRIADGDKFLNEMRGQCGASSPAPVPLTDERERIRAAQDKAVMPLIGPLLDAWENADREVMAEEPELAKWLSEINKAMETAGDDETAPEQAAQVWPEGWPIKRDMDWIAYQRPDGWTQSVTPHEPQHKHSQTLFMLLDAMLAASPPAPSQATQAQAVSQAYVQRGYLIEWPIMGGGRRTLWNETDDAAKAIGCPHAPAFVLASTAQKAPT